MDMPRTTKVTEERVRRTRFPSGAYLDKGEYKLPEQLDRGAKMESRGKSGKANPCLFSAIMTSHRTEFGEAIYRLTFPEQHHHMPAITSEAFWTRDQLQEAKARIIE